MGFWLTQASQKYVMILQFFVCFITRKPCYRRKNRAMPLLISIHIDVYSDIARFYCDSTTFVLEMAKITEKPTFVYLLPDAL